LIKKKFICDDDITDKEKSAKLAVFVEEKWAEFKVNWMNVLDASTPEL